MYNCRFTHAILGQCLNLHALLPHLNLEVNSRVSDSHSDA
jgi:hypothetical protein